MSKRKCRATHQKAAVRFVGYLDASDGSAGHAWQIEISCRRGCRRVVDLWSIA